MTPDQIKWMCELSGRSDAFQASADLQNRKDGLLAEAFEVLDAKVAEIRLGEDFAMEMKQGALGGFLRRTFKVAAPTTQSIGAKGDPDKAFDTGHDLAGSAGLSAEQAASLTRAHAIIIDQVEILRGERDEATGKKLFSDVEISREIFEPLMRRKIIPENAISDRYSDVSRTFDAASEQYDLRLAAYTETVSSTAKLAGKLGLGSDVLKGAGTAASGIMGLVTAIKPGFPLTEAVDICTACTLTLSTPLDITAAVLKDKGLNPKNVEGIAKTVVAASAGWVTAAFDIKFDNGTDSDKIHQQLGKAIVSGLKIGLSSGTFFTKLAQGGKASEAFDEVGTIIEQCCACAGSGGAYREGEKDDGSLATVGRRIREAFQGSKELIVMGTAATSDDPIATVAKSMQNLVKTAIEEGSKVYATEREAALKQADTDQQAKEDKKDPANKAAHKAEFDAAQTFEKNFDTTSDAANIASATGALAPAQLDLTNLLKLAQTMSRAQLDKLFKDDPQLKGNAKAQKLMETIWKKREQEIAAAGETMDDEVARDDMTFRQLLSGSEALDSDAEVEQIEFLILQIKKDQLVVKIAETFASLGPAAVAAFLPPASIAVDAVQLAIAMRKAICHFMAWLEWNANVTDARSAMSVQAAAMANRAGLSGEAAARESVKALEAAIKLVGDALATAGGPFAPAGVGISKGVSALSSLKDIILKIYDAKELHQNWLKYQAALANPADRKAIRAAMRGNPTLAKYTIAYGAVVAGDPVAKNALRKCGLSSKVLQSPNTNEQKVVAYLETLYVEDPIVLERLDDPPRWHPGPVELTATGIATFSQAAQAKAKPALAAPAPRGLVTATMAMEKAAETLEASRAAWAAASTANPPNEAVEAAALEAFVADLNVHAVAVGTVRGGLIGWAPQGADGKPQTDVVAYRDGLMRIAQVLQSRANRELALYDTDPL